MNWEEEFKILFESYSYKELSQILCVSSALLYAWDKKKCIPRAIHQTRIHKVYLKKQNDKLFHPLINWEKELKYLFDRYKKTELSKMMGCNVMSLRFWETKTRIPTFTSRKKINKIYEQVKSQEEKENEDN